MSQDAREILTRRYGILREAIEEAGGIVLPVVA